MQLSLDEILFFPDKYFPKTYKYWNSFFDEYYKGLTDEEKAEYNGIWLGGFAADPETGLNPEQEIMNIFHEEYNYYIDKEEYFPGCPVKIYSKTYFQRFDQFKLFFPDATEKDFIDAESSFSVFEYYSHLKNLDEITQQSLLYSLKRKKDFLRDRRTARLEPDNIEKVLPVKFHGKQTELMELIKALVQTGMIKGTQKELVQRFSVFFQKEIKNPDKLLQDIKNRNNGSETLFLDHLKETLLDYIKN